MRTKQDNIIFYNNEFSKFSKNGVVAMIISGWSDANGHIALWNGKDKKFLDNSNYLLDSRDIVIVQELYFWELL
ncbi:T6SS effector amidase Tae4 family protein [uncultured Helicobacter sp.]|uniref:T6SS effector amidase Tae4 family protein n=1 Tax=uncultured Helicobacter sp. TaxID=175537 RepID=UPI00374F2725